MIINKTVSLADQVFERLEADILMGKYSRGTILTELGLCEDLGVSRTPIREALRRLEQEHIVESTPKGAKVLSITRKDAEVIFEIREKVEGLAARACARNVTDEELQEMKEILDLQEFYITKNDTEKLKALDGQFHSKIYAFSGSPVYYDTLLPLHVKIQKFRHLNLNSQNRAESSISEHRKLWDALASHNEDLAEKMMMEHVDHARQRLTEIDFPEEAE